MVELLVAMTTFFLINPSAPSGPLPLGFQPQPFGETRAPRKDEQKRFAPDSQGEVDWVGIGVGDWPGWTFCRKDFLTGDRSCGGQTLP